MNVIVHHSPVGPLTLKSDGEKLISVWFEKDKRDASRPDAPNGKLGKRDPILDQTRRELDQYFAGKRKTFDVKFGPAEGTDFQRAVWTALTRIPYGVTVSYGHIAKAIGLPKAVRAVGAANGQNPIPIIVPCHRVIGADGSLTGFGGGLDRKRYLLGLERGEAPLL